jgi:helix-turn-helix protein
MVTKIPRTTNEAEPIDERPDDDELLTEQQAAEELGVSSGTLSVWRSTGRYCLAYVKIGRLVRYRKGTLRAWTKARTRGTGATA